MAFVLSGGFANFTFTFLFSLFYQKQEFIAGKLIVAFSFLNWKDPLVLLYFSPTIG